MLRSTPAQRTKKTKKKPPKAVAREISEQQRKHTQDSGGINNRKADFKNKKETQRDAECVRERVDYPTSGTKRNPPHPARTIKRKLIDIKETQL